MITQRNAQSVFILALVLSLNTFIFSDQKVMPSILRAVREKDKNRDFIKKYRDANGNGALHIAVEEEDTQAIEELTEMQPISWFASWYSSPKPLVDIDQKNNDGDTALHIASKKRRPLIIALLRKKQANPEVVNNQQLSPVFIALEQDDTDSMKSFMEHGLNPRKQTIGNMPMFAYTIENSKNKSFNFFADRDISLVNEAGNNGIKPIHRAVKSNNLFVLQRLLHNYNVSIHSTDNDGDTPAHYSAIYGTPRAMEYLIQNGADITKQNNKGEDTLDLAIKCKKNNIFELLISQPGTNINRQNKLTGDTYAMTALKAGNNDVLEALLINQVNLNLTNIQGRNIAHISALTNNRDGVSLILAKNRNILFAVDKDGNRPLDIATQEGQEKIADMFIENGAPVTTRDNDGNTLLHKAIRAKNTILINKYLSKLASSINQKNNNGETPMHCAADADEVEVIKYLQRHGITAIERDKKGNTAMHHAAQRNSVQAIKYFKSIGENFDSRNDDNETVFQAGAIKGNLEVTKFFLQDSEKQFINGEVESILNKLQYSRLPAKEFKTYQFIKDKHEERLSESKKIHNEYLEVVKIMEAKRNSITFVTVRNFFNGGVCALQCPDSQLNKKSVDQIYHMTKEERTDLLNHYLQCKNKQLQYKIIVDEKVNTIKREEEREKQRLADLLEAQRKQAGQARQAILDAQRLRDAQIREQRELLEEQEKQRKRVAELAKKQQEDKLKKDAEEKARAEVAAQEKEIAYYNKQKKDREDAEKARQARHTAALEGQHIPVPAPSAPAAEVEHVVGSLEPSAPPMDEEPETNIAECFCCKEDRPLITIPCGSVPAHSDKICSGCLNQLISLKKPCPICRRPLPKK